MFNLNKTIKGFTLIELVVVISIIGILGLIFSDILIQTLRGQNKVKVIDQVKQNGQASLDRLSDEIRQSEKIVCFVSQVNNGSPDTIVLFRQGAYTRFRFYAPTTAANGSIAWDNPQFTDFLCTEPQVSSSLQYLTDKDPVNGVSVSYDGSMNNPIFTVSRLAGYSDSVTVKFRASQGVKAGQTPESSVNQGGIIFSTTVQVRAGK